MATRKPAGGRKPKPPDAHAFLRGIGKHTPAPVYLLTGDEPFFKARCVSALRKKILGRDAPAAAVQTHTGKRQGGEAPIDAVALIEDLRTGSLFDAVRLVRVEEARALIDKGAEAVLAYLEQPAPGVHLVLEAVSVDGRTRVGKGLAKHAVTIDCRRPFDHPPPWQSDAEPWDHPLAAWVVAEGRLHGVQMEKPVAHALTQRVGSEPGLLSRECERLAAILGGTRREPRPLNAVDLDALVPDTRGEDLFRLGDAITRRDVADTLKVLDALFRNGVPERSGGRTRDVNAVAIRALGWTHRTLRELWAARDLAGGGASTGDVARSLGKKPVFAEQLVRDARRWRDARFEAIWPRLRDTDVALKTGSPPRLTLERLLITIVPPPTAPWEQARA